MSSRILLVVLLFMEPGVGWGAEEVDQHTQCGVPIDLPRYCSSLPATSAALSEGRRITIVALGSSSTGGVGNCDRSALYPAVLERELSSRLASPVVVLNRGVAGDTIQQTAARIDSDVLSSNPTLVIWQTGTNDMVHAVPIITFEEVLSTGIRRLRAHGIDVILMDPQYFPQGEATLATTPYLNAIDEIGKRYDVPVLHRHRIMSYWIASGEMTVPSMLSHDQFHMSNRSHRCLGKILSNFIIGSFSRSPF